MRVAGAGIVGTLAGITIAMAAAKVIPPTYRASSVIEFVELPGAVPLSDAARDARIDGVVEGARSLTVAKALLADRRIATDPDLIRDARAFGSGRDTKALALLDRLHAERIGATTLVRLEATDDHPARAARLADAAADALIRRSLADRVAAAGPAHDTLTRDLADARTRAEAADAALATFRAGLDLSGPPGAPLDPAEVVALRTTTASARGEAAAASTRARAAARHLVVSAASVGQNGTASLAELRTRRADLARKLAELDLMFMPSYPLVAGARAEMAALDRAIAAEMDGLAGSASADAAAARSRLAILSLGLTDAEGRRARALGADADYARLQRQADTAHEAYRLLQQGALQRSTDRSLARAELRPAVLASVPLKPASPDPLLLALFGGFAFGLAAMAATIWAERRRLVAMRIEV